MADGFLGRWSRRKLDAKEGRPLAEPPPPVPAAVAPAVPVPPVAEPPVAATAEPVPAEVPPPPTLEDVRSLTPESDFSRFVARDVAPDVKNAAVRKLFTDPRFNVQDGLDVYIDDYSQPDPIPASMLRSLASAQFLGLFREEGRKDEPPAGSREAAEELGPESVAQSGTPQPPLPTPPDAPPADHADPDLRLQQDHAAPGQEPGHGTG